MFSICAPFCKRIMKINDLPNDCFRSIFDHFSLQELLQYRAVCSHWRILIEKICAQKSSLKLFESFNVVYNYCNCLLQYTLYEHEDFVLKRIGQGDDDLLISGRPVRRTLKVENEPIAEPTGHLLGSLFPNINKLVFYYYNWPTEMDLHAYLGNWSFLTSLSLLGLPHLKQHHMQIWNAINSLQFLNRLHLFEVTDIIPELPVMQQLEQFTLVNYDGDIVALLSQLGTPIRHLNLDGINCELQQFKELLRRVPFLSTHLTHLSIGHLFCGENATVYKSRTVLRSILHLICISFKSLTYFHPKFVYQLPLTEQVEEVIQIDQLHELRLHIHSFQMHLDQDQASILSQLTEIHTLSLDYTLLDIKIDPDDFKNLVPEKFAKVHTLNCQIEFHDTDLLTLIQMYFDNLKARVKYSINFKDCLLVNYMGRHRERYKTEFENAIA